MAKMTNKELDIIGAAYQSGFDALVELLGETEDRHEKLRKIAVAETWIYFPGIRSLEATPNKEDFEVLFKIAEDIDKLSSICWSQSEEGQWKIFFALMEVNDKLYCPLNRDLFLKWGRSARNVSVFGKNMRYYLDCMTSSLLCAFDTLIRDINEGKVTNHVPWRDWVFVPTDVPKLSDWQKRQKGGVFP